MSGFVRWLVTPDPLLNHVFLARVYAALAVLAVALYCAQEFAGWTSVTGYWLVPAPTVPALPYVLWLSTRATAGGAAPAAATAAATAAAAGGKGEGSGDGSKKKR